jgi:hypothetical protein
MFLHHRCPATLPWRGFSSAFLRAGRFRRAGVRDAPGPLAESRTLSIRSRLVGSNRPRFADGRGVAGSAWGRWRWFGRRGVAAAVDQARRAAGSPGGVERCLNCSEPGCAEPCTEWPARWSRELVLARAGNVLFAVTPAMASDKRSPAPVQKSLIFGGFWWAHQGSNLGHAD